MADTGSTKVLEVCAMHVSEQPCKVIFLGLPDACTVSNFKLGYLGTDAHDVSDNLMTGNDRLECNQLGNYQE